MAKKNAAPKDPKDVKHRQGSKASIKKKKSETWKEYYKRRGKINKKRSTIIKKAIAAMGPAKLKKRAKKAWITRRARYGAKGISKSGMANIMKGRKKVVGTKYNMSGKYKGKGKKKKAKK